ncbi:cilia- and flagella-associated protein 251 [Aplysia californica]|uniref:Cilia- and flagella-associated protein 251 n=1 Tax=Aplysia californica TaxID=6500 RepID=A0ABM1A9A6_APLCA|nr:cilia- and flagella-associated protein 251 [Aplysia californica]
MISKREKKKAIVGKEEKRKEGKATAVSEEEMEEDETEKGEGKEKVGEKEEEEEKEHESEIKEESLQGARRKIIILPGRYYKKDHDEAQAKSRKHGRGKRRTRRLLSEREISDLVLEHMESEDKAALEAHIPALDYRPDIPSERPVERVDEYFAKHRIMELCNVSGFREKKDVCHLVILFVSGNH